MTMSCIICNHTQRLEIDRELVQGKNLTKLARDYGVSTDSLYGHKENHLSRQLVQAYQKKELAESMDLMNRIEDILSKAKNIFDRNYTEKKDDLALRALTEQRSTIELLCKIAAYWHEARAMELHSQQGDYESRRKEEGRENAARACDRLNEKELNLFCKLIEKVEGRTNEVIVPYTPEFPVSKTSKSGIIEAAPEPIPFDTPNEEITLSEQSSPIETIETEPNPLAVRPIKPTQIPGGSKAEVTATRRKLARALGGSISTPLIAK